MSRRKRKAADRAARDAVTSSAAAEESGQLRTAYLDRRRRQGEHDAAQRQLRAARKAEGPSATERALMTATADTLPGTRYDWHLDFVRLHSARRVDLRGTPEIDPRLVNRLTTAERMQARERHSLAAAFLEKHAPAQARAYRLAFLDAGGLWGGMLSGDHTPEAEAHAVEEEVAVLVGAAVSVARHRLWAAVRHVLAACDGIVPEAVADYATARTSAIRKAEREERARHWKAVQSGQVDAGAIRQ